MGEVKIRAVQPADMDALFVMHRDPASNYMAAFTVEDPDDREFFDQSWQRRMDDEKVVARVILYEDEIAGTMLKFDLFDLPTVGYTVRQDLWGRGIATQALRLLLEEVKERPLYARAAKDNLGSRRVLEKCGFVQSGIARGYAHARRSLIEEVVMRLD